MGHPQTGWVQPTPAKEQGFRISLSFRPGRSEGNPAENKLRRHAAMQDQEYKQNPFFKLTNQVIVQPHIVRIHLNYSRI